MKDEQLVNSFKKGNRDGFEILMGRYQKSLYYMVKAMVIEPEDAKDITQKSFVRTFNNIQGLREPGRFKQWLFRIAADMARDALRGRRKYVSLEESGLGPVIRQTQPIWQTQETLCAE